MILGTTAPTPATPLVSTWSGTRSQPLDGDIGKGNQATYEVGTSTLVIDTGPWVMVPAGVVDRVDTDEQKVYVGCTKDQIKDAPEYDEDAGDHDDYRPRLGGYYGEFYR